MARSEEIPVAGAARNRSGVRGIKLRNFLSGHVIVCYDDGCDEQGRPNQQRQHLINVLRKRCKFQGKEFPTFVLAEPPEAWPETRSERLAQLRAIDRFDTEALRTMDGTWRVATPAWEEASSKAVAADKKQAEEQSTRSRAERAARGLEAIDMLRELGTKSQRRQVAQ